jgi:glycerol-3-phosphate O-acyltransferase/dihydroxyacetone phosphate acyltransferase
MYLERLQRILTYHKLLMAFALPRPRVVDARAMEVYMKPPRPPANPFVKHQEGAQVDATLEGGEDAPAIPIRAPGTSRELVRRLLEARDEANEALSGYLRLRESEALVEMLVSKGAVVGL